MVTESEPAAYVRHGKAQAEPTQWQHALTGKLAAPGLGASLTPVGPPDGKRLLYNEAYKSSDKQPATTQPTTTYVFPLARGSDQNLRLTLYALPLDRNRRLLVALASGLTALLADAALLIWAGRWLIAPLQRLNMQVDAIAGGDPIDTRATSPLREVDNVAAAVAGMAARLAQAAEQDARLEAEQRLLVRESQGEDRKRAQALLDTRETRREARLLQPADTPRNLHGKEVLSRRRR